MEKQEYLNEESYQKTKKKIILISIIILVVGLVMGLTLIGIGISKGNTTEKDNVSTVVTNDDGKTLEEVKKELTEVEEKITTAKEELNALQSSIGDSDNYIETGLAVSSKQQEIFELESDKDDLELEIKKFTSGYYKTANSIETEADSITDTAKRLPYFIFGGFIIITSGMISLSIYLFAKKRELAAFNIEQTMPVYEETAEKVAPTIANVSSTVAGSVAKSITEGIKEGLKDDDEK